MPLVFNIIWRRFEFPFSEMHVIAACNSITEMLPFGAQFGVGQVSATDVERVVEKVVAYIAGVISFLFVEWGHCECPAAVRDICAAEFEIVRVVELVVAVAAIYDRSEIADTVRRVRNLLRWIGVGQLQLYVVDALVLGWAIVFEISAYRLVTKSMQWSTQPDKTYS